MTVAGRHFDLGDAVLVMAGCDEHVFANNDPPAALVANDVARLKSVGDPDALHDVLRHRGAPDAIGHGVVGRLDPDLRRTLLDHRVAEVQVQTNAAADVYVIIVMISESLAAGRMLQRLPAASGICVVRFAIHNHISLSGGLIRIAVLDTGESTKLVFANLSISC